MPIATRLGPWLIGTVKDTTGTTAGTIRNIGATAVSQNKAIAFNDAANTVAFVLPAGSIIQNFQILATTAFTTGSTATITIAVNGTNIVNAQTITVGSTGITAVPGVGGVNPGLVANVGPTDAVITYTIAAATAGAGFLTVAYIVRNPDGSYAPTSFTA